MQSQINSTVSKNHKNPKNLILSLKLKYKNAATAIEFAACPEKKLNELLDWTTLIKELISGLLQGRNRWNPFLKRLVV